MITCPQLESALRVRLSGAKRVLAISLVLVAAVPAVAQQSRVYRDGRSWVEESNGTLPQSRTLRVSSHLGNIRVQGGKQIIKWVVIKRAFATTEQQARRQFERMRVGAGRKVDGGFLRADFVGAHPTRFAADIYVEVPRDMESVYLDSKAGNLVVVGTTARVDVATQAGSISVDDVAGSVRAHTAGGDIQIGNVGGRVGVKSGGGNVAINSTKARSDVFTSGGNISIGSTAGASVRTEAGSIEVQHCAGDLLAKTAGGTLELGDVLGNAVLDNGGGNIRLGGARGRVMATTVGGNIQLFKLSQGAQAQTGAGTITVELIGSRGGFAESFLRTNAGDVLVYLNAAVPLTVHAASEMASGRGIRTDFPELKITTEGGEFGPKTMYADGILNGGGPVLKVRTTIGQIEFRRTK
ncbi:MAG TPA: hypothetical protein VN622_03450 [Clostridia bacterium]|nr:hypothetical protein [Clostridia bacterium]